MGYWKNIFSVKNSYQIYFHSLIVGLICGAVSLLFVTLLQLAEEFIASLHIFQAGYPYNLSQAIANGHYTIIAFIVLAPAIGGLIAGMITHYFAKDAAGTGANEMINAFHNKGGEMNTKLPLIKSVATIVTLSSGGSGGKEGPVAQIGAGIGVWVSKLLNTGERARRTLLLAGTAAGLGSVFRAPLGGALTAVEMVYKEDIESDALIPCFISSVTAFLIFTTFTTHGDFIQVGYVSKFHFKELPLYVLLGVLCYVYGYLFLKGFKDTRVFIKRLSINPIIKPAIGGLLVGLLSLFFFEVAGTGGNYLQLIFDGLTPQYLGASVWMVALSFLLIAFLKIVASTLTIGSGGSAGIFGPSLFVGGLLGASVGTIAQYIFPQNDISVSSFIIVGMGAFYAGVASAPIAGIIMVCEITGSYILLPPLILVSIFTFIMSKKINLYTSQVENRFNSPAHLWDMKIDVLRSTKITDHFKEFRTLAVVADTITAEELRKKSVDIYASDFVMTDNCGVYIGVISLRKYKTEQIYEGESSHYKTMLSNAPSVYEYQTLADALNIILQYDVDKVAVANNENKTLGYIRSRDLFDSYLKMVKR